MVGPGPDPVVLPIRFTAYMKYRLATRRFDANIVENVLQTSAERYFDTETQRHVVVGRHRNAVIMIPYEVIESTVVPVTVHTTTRQQINFRLRTGRLVHE